MTISHASRYDSDSLLGKTLEGRCYKLGDLGVEESITTVSRLERIWIGRDSAFYGSIEQQWGMSLRVNLCLVKPVLAIWDDFQPFEDITRLFLSKTIKFQGCQIINDEM